MTTLETLTKDQKSLLLFCECCCVDNAGIYQPERTNDTDRQNLDTWREEGFLDHGRVSSEHLSPTRRLWVRLGHEAMAMAQTLRRDRAERMWKNRTWTTTEEKRLAKEEVPE